MQNIQTLIQEKYDAEIHNVHAFILDDLHSTNADLANAKLDVFEYQVKEEHQRDTEIVVRPDSMVIERFDNFMMNNQVTNEISLLNMLIKPLIKGNSQIADTIIELLAVQVQKLKALDPGVEDVKTASFITFADGQAYRYDVFIWSKQFSSPQIINTFGQTSALLVARSNISRTKSDYNAVDANYMPLVKLAFPENETEHQVHLQRCRMVMLSRNR
ncbi:hypothetical protein EQG49_11780 [Periweissella cryptocerci]|uniref:Uncharacterized protein n=1 Tax=Periweissella cryptocerci TaxID=2506420 RepID=A0A4P6YW74_9LACO|nr:hypothetical protein [Periweissella cryptocerci]QBO37084.1 hypothetical protein EQG49_11780 [Periweissella cryptocerci]